MDVERQRRWCSTQTQANKVPMYYMKRYTCYKIAKFVGSHDNPSQGVSSDVHKALSVDVQSESDASNSENVHVLVEEVIFQ